MAQSQADVYRSVKIIPKNLFKKNRDLKSVSGFTASRILLTIQHYLLGIKYLIYINRKCLVFLEKKIWIKEKKEQLISVWGKT